METCGGKPTIMNINRRPKEPVLIIEDLKENQLLIKGMLGSLNIDCCVASSGKEALELIGKENFSIYIVDLVMPVMTGIDFIKLLREDRPDSVILVQTILNSNDTIIQTMKLGVFDYIIKPLDKELFLQTVLKALEYKYLLNIENENRIRGNRSIRNQIDWLNYKESLRLVGNDPNEKSSIYNLKTTLSQGSGFGSMTSVIDMIRSSSKKISEGKIEVNEELLELLFENNEITKNILKGLSNVSEILDKKMNPGIISGYDFVNRIPEFTKSLESFLKLKNIHFNFPSFNSNCSLNIDLEYIQLLIEELALNAFKYSKKGETIDFFAHINNGYLVITVKNIIRDDEYGGIPEWAERLVTQPFFRIHPPDETVNAIERFSLGLGLTIVENIISKHNGLFFIHNANDYTSKESKTCVLAEVFIPLI